MYLGGFGIFLEKHTKIINSSVLLGRSLNLGGSIFCVWVLSSIAGGARFLALRYAFALFVTKQMNNAFELLWHCPESKCFFFLRKALIRHSCRLAIDGTLCPSMTRLSKLPAKTAWLCCITMVANQAGWRTYALGRMHSESRRSDP